MLGLRVERRFIVRLDHWRKGQLAWSLHAILLDSVVHDGGLWSKSHPTHRQTQNGVNQRKREHLPTYKYTSSFIDLIRRRPRSTPRRKQCTAARRLPGRYPSSPPKPATCTYPSSRTHLAWRWCCHRRWPACRDRTTSRGHCRQDACSSC